MTTPPATDRWESTTTLDEIAAWLAPANSVLVLTHAKPDGDAIGSAIGLVRALRLAARSVAKDPATIRARFVGPVPRWLNAVADADEHDHLDAKPLTDDNPHENPDALVVVDTGSRSQLEAAAEFVAARADRNAIIDHHLDGDPTLAARRVLDFKASAACVTIADLCRRILGLDSIADLPQPIAQVLYLGIASDTGWFRHSNVDPRTMRTAADLLEAGADHGALYTLSEQQQRASRLRLLGRVLTNMRLLCDGQLAILPVSALDKAETGVLPGESSGFADLALTIETVRVAVVITEVENADPPACKLSLRSKAGPDRVNVNEVARGFGGGGHAQASGARSAGTIEQIADRLEAAVGEALRARA